eukprot:1142592-Pelagomonas_calceolata.AAC.2
MMCRVTLLFLFGFLELSYRSASVICPLPGCHHMDSALHILLDCQCPVIRNMVTERHNIASRVILKVVGEGSYSLVGQTSYKWM